MASFSQLWTSYQQTPRPGNFGATVAGIRLGELDDEVQDLAGSCVGLGAAFDAVRADRLRAAVEQIERLLPQLEPPETQRYFGQLAALAAAMLGELSMRPA